MPLERFSAAWREDYVSSSAALDNSKENTSCVFCTLSAEDVSVESGVLLKTEFSFVTLTLIPMDRAIFWSFHFDTYKDSVT